MFLTLYSRWNFVCGSQVHALNILRALYRDTRLGENIVPFVSEGMQAAVLGFTSPVWAVSLYFLFFFTSIYCNLNITTNQRLECILDRRLLTNPW